MDQFLYSSPKEEAATFPRPIMITLDEMQGSGD